MLFDEPDVHIIQVQTKKQKVVHVHFLSYTNCRFGKYMVSVQTRLQNPEHTKSAVLKEVSGICSLGLV